MDAVSRRVEKRNRPPLSCEPCRTRKSKCNRATPCDSCIKRNQPSSCHYAANVRRSEASSSKKTNLTDRLRNLEALVSSFASRDLVVQQRSRTDGSSDAAAAMPNEGPGLQTGASPNIDSQFNQNQDQKGLDTEAPRIRQTYDGPVNYVDSNHWLSILEDIREVREHLSPEGNFLQQEMPTGSGAGWEPGIPEVSSVLGLNASSNLDDILTSLPPRPTCDRLLSHYFNSRYLVLGIVHPLEFQKEYETFWEAPTKAPVLWIALLFSLLSMATILLRLARLHEPDHESLPPVKTLQERAAECLILGGFATANAYALEAFILHLQSRFLSEGRSSRASVHLWFEAGTVIRLAIRMGYHRDPSKTASISPFQAEMRRRVWVNIFQVDALLSFQMGFPSMIPTEHCDAQPPLNLEYSDLDPTMPTLPPPRPLTTDTPVLYIIAKSSVMRTFKRIVAHTQRLPSSSTTPTTTTTTITPTPPLTTTTPPLTTTTHDPTDTHKHTIALDLEARDVYARVPPLLQRRDAARCGVLDTAARIVERASVELLHLKSLVVLHRRFVRYHNTTDADTTGRPEGGGGGGGASGTGTGMGMGAGAERSRRACVEAALEMLARQADLAQASRVGGRLYRDRWMLLSLMAHDFLLAAMVLCLDLSVRLGRVEGRDRRRRHRRRQGGGGGGGGYDDDGDDGDDGGLAERTYRALQTSRGVWAETSALSPEAHTATFALDLMLRKVSEKRNAEALLGQHGAQPSPVVVDEAAPSPADAGLPYAHFMSDVIDGATAPDWNLLDQYFQNPDMEPADVAAWDGEATFPPHFLDLE
ncbi:uncharacterized protein B0H64DRAFT_364827 [Chaetomium fimeti]|uniref:Zn(2)-C6 fungal-type domain-containing protein n=1 Tax=Chaetomium fimeti TaxID=1854472 RepID=A0AAE0HAU2_9PEZI|nr:hypothetical protein B0H64DRAFT_364827 [Chaetomium fimeti]